MTILRDDRLPRTLRSWWSDLWEQLKEWVMLPPRPEPVPVPVQQPPRRR